MNRIEFTSNGDLIVRFHDENGRETESRAWSEGEQMVTVRQFFADGHAVGVQNAMELLAADHFGMSILDEHCDSWNDAINQVLVGAAMRRIISTELGAYGDEHDSSYVLDTQTIEDYTRDELVEAILAVMLENVWREREEVLIVAARGLGFARVGRRIRAAFASAFNGAIRRGLLEYDGTLVRQP